MERKRVRSANFTPEEKFLCLKLVSEYKEILDSKRTNAETWKEKEDTWKMIVTKFNSLSTAKINRTKENLKKFYENRKKILKAMAKTKGILKSDDGSLNNSVVDYTYRTDLSSHNDLKHEFDDKETSEDILSEEIILRMNSDSDNIEIIHDDLMTDMDNVQSEEDLETNYLSPQHSYEYHVEPSGKKRKYESNISINRRHRGISATTALTRRYADLATVKTECSQLQLDIFKIEKANALLRLQKDEYDFKRRKEENGRKLDEYEIKKREYEIQKEREEELFILNRQSLLLDIEIKKKQLHELSSK